MHRSIMVVDASLDEGRKLCAILDRHHYSATPLHSLEELSAAVQKRVCHGLILDLDSLPVDNRFIRDLCNDNPDLCVIGTSTRTFHPELEESMRTHISACLRKPVDETELLYWLKSICGRDPKSGVIPKSEGRSTRRTYSETNSSRKGLRSMEKDQGKVEMEKPAVGQEKREHPRDGEQHQAGKRGFLQKVLGGAAAVACATLALERNAHATAPDAGGDTTRRLDAPKNLAEGNLLERMRQDLLRALNKPVSERKWVMIIDQQKCIGCCACNISCNTENNLPPGVVYRPVLRQEVGKYPNVSRIFTPKPCMHCDNPPCVPVCPVKATWKREDGVVVIDYDICIGCRNCLLACPYSARTADFGEFYGSGTPEIMPYETRPNYEYSKEWKRKPNSEDSPVGNARKCQFCLHRLREGMLPACVTTCLGGATYFGDYNDKTSLVHKLLGSFRVRQLKPELGTQPSVFYLI